MEYQESIDQLKTLPSLFSLGPKKDINKDEREHLIRIIEGHCQDQGYIAKRNACLDAAVAFANHTVDCERFPAIWNLAFSKQVNLLVSVKG